MHSTFSDGKLSIPELVDLYGGLGFGAIAITDHLCEKHTFLGRAAAYLGKTLTPATFPIYREILRSEKERAWREYRMLLIPGFELTKNTVSNHRSAHVLALGATEWIDADLPIEELCAAIRAQGGLAIAAHPVSTRKFEKQTLHLWDRRHELDGHFDAWEAASGQHLFGEVIAAGVPILGSSDLHRREQLSSWKTRFYCRRDWDEIKAAVREQRLDLEYFDEKEISRGTPLRTFMDRMSLGDAFPRPAFSAVGLRGLPSAL